MSPASNETLFPIFSIAKQLPVEEDDGDDWIDGVVLTEMNYTMQLNSLCSIEEAGYSFFHTHYWCASRCALVVERRAARKLLSRNGLG